MRETDPIDPMWEGAGDVKPGPRLASAGVRRLGALAGKLAPNVVSWASGMAPELRLSWGARVYHLRRDGMVSVRRAGEGYEDNPRRNYNDAVEKRQARAAKVVEEAPPEPVAAPQPAPEPEPSAAPVVDLSAEAMAAEVQHTMGMSVDAEGSDPDDAPPTAESVKERLVAMRSLLQSLDDVGDYDLVEAVDEELYLLHKAVDYKLKNHKASEAKAKLDTLFK